MVGRKRSFPRTLTRSLSDGRIGSVSGYRGLGEVEGEKIVDIGVFGPLRQLSEDVA